MIMNKDTKEYTCNACNKTFRKIKCLKYHIKTEDVHTAAYCDREAKFIHYQKNCVTMFIAYKIFFIKNVFYNFYIMCHGTPQRYVPVEERV